MNKIFLNSLAKQFEEGAQLAVDEGILKSAHVESLLHTFLSNPNTLATLYDLDTYDTDPIQFKGLLDIRFAKGWNRATRDRFDYRFAAPLGYNRSPQMTNMASVDIIDVVDVRYSFLLCTQTCSIDNRVPNRFINDQGQPDYGAEDLTAWITICIDTKLHK